MEVSICIPLLEGHIINYWYMIFLCSRFWCDSNPPAPPPSCRIAGCGYVRRCLCLALFISECLPACLGDVTLYGGFHSVFHFMRLHSFCICRQITIQGLIVGYDSLSQGYDSLYPGIVGYHSLYPDTMDYDSRHCGLRFPLSRHYGL